jgi:hypothetical protein
MLHSSFRDAHKGRVFTIYFENYPNGFTARLEIEGLPARKYFDKIWEDREQAKADVSNDAKAQIEAMAV